MEAYVERLRHRGTQSALALRTSARKDRDRGGKALAILVYLSSGLYMLGLYISWSGFDMRF